jgi:hypothetical protein
VTVKQVDPAGATNEIELLHWEFADGDGWMDETDDVIQVETGIGEGVGVDVGQRAGHAVSS